MSDKAIQHLKELQAAVGGADPFLAPELPDHPMSINVSGGRTSGYMLYRFLQSNKGLPPNSRAVFANTGREHPGTLDFVLAMERAWSVKIHWVEFDRNNQGKGTARDPRNIYRIVNRETAAQNGEPFEKLIKVKKSLPTPFRRFCTEQLKVETIHRFLRHEFGLGPRDPYINTVGIRADEPRRLKMGLMKNCLLFYPLAIAGVTQEDVLEFWKEQSFDLNIPEDLGNCDGCFLKSKGQIQRVIRNHPERGQWWIDIEANLPYRKMPFTFLRDESYTALARRALAEEDEAGGVDCFCGD